MEYLDTIYGLILIKFLKSQWKNLNNIIKNGRNLKKFELNYLIKKIKEGIKDNEDAKYKADDGVKRNESTNVYAMMDNNDKFEKVKK